MDAVSSQVVDGARERWFLGTYLRIVANAADTGGSLTVMEQLAPLGFSPPTHIHTAEDSAMFVLDGHLVARIGDDEIAVGPGEMVWLPRAIPHSFLVDAADTRFLEFITPSGFEEFHVDTSEPAGAREIPPPSEPDIGALIAGLGRYGAEIVGPPMELLGRTEGIPPSA